MPDLRQFVDRRSFQIDVEECLDIRSRNGKAAQSGGPTLHQQKRADEIVIRCSGRLRCSHDKFRLVSQIPGGSVC